MYGNIRSGRQNAEYIIGVKMKYKAAPTDAAELNATITVQISAATFLQDIKAFEKIYMYYDYKGK